VELVRAVLGDQRLGIEHRLGRLIIAAETAVAKAITIKMVQRSAVAGSVSAKPPDLMSACGGVEIFIRRRRSARSTQRDAARLVRVRK